MRRPHAREIVNGRPLTGPLIYSQMKRLFPRRNDFGCGSFEELVPELARFGIDTIGKFRQLMTRLRRQLLRMDSEPLCPPEERMWSEDLGRELVRDKLRRQYWFAYPGLVRIAAEMEFGPEAEVCADEA